MTGAALEALNAVKHPDTEGQKKAFEYLREARDPERRLSQSSSPKAEPNVASTAWVVQAMWSAGINPEDMARRTPAWQPKNRSAISPRCNSPTGTSATRQARN